MSKIIEVNREHSKIVCKIVEKYKKPIEEKTPIIVQSWEGKNRENPDGYKKFWVSNTGKMLLVPGDRNCFLLDVAEALKVKDENRLAGNRAIAPNSYGYFGIYVNYHEKYDMVEIAAILLDGKRGKDGIPKKWEFYPNGHNRWFWFYDDRVIYNTSGKQFWPSEEGKYYNKYWPKKLNDLDKMKMSSASIAEFKKFAKIDNFRGSRYSTDSLRFTWGWGEFYKKIQPRPENKNTKKYEEMNAVKLTPLSELEKRYPADYTKHERLRLDGNIYYSYDFRKKDFYHFEIINENLAVVRYLERCRLNPYSSEDRIDNEFTEWYRIFITDKGDVKIFLKTSEDKYKISSVKASSIASYYSSVTFGNFEELKNFKRTKYIYDIVKESNHPIEALINILRHPVVERFAKSGYNNIAQSLMTNCEVSRNFEHMFAQKEKSTGSLNQLTGLNKEQLKWVEDRTILERGYLRNNACDAIKAIKLLYGTNDISSWSSKSTQELLPIFKSLIENSGRRWVYDLDIDCNNYYSDDHAIEDSRKKEIVSILKATHGDNRHIRLVIDTFRMYKYLNNKPNIGNIYDVKKYTDLTRLHDALIELKNIEDAERRAYYNAQEKERLEQDKKKFEKGQEERRKKFNFTTDEDNFLIKIPEELSEITAEGTALRHCVGGYIHNHASGQTNILFLRKKDMESTPFYTIEVRSDHVVQLHGMANRWLGNNPEAIPFVIKWLKEKGIRCDKRILLETATGYGSTGRLLNAADYGL